MTKYNEKPIVLIVDDMYDSAELLASILGEDYQVEVAMSGEMGVMLARMEPQPDIILLDIVMPVMDGYDVCRHLKQDSKTRDIPVIFITSRDDVNDETLGLEIGGVDFITKPINPPVVEARISTHLALHRQKQEVEDALSRHISIEKMRDNLVCMISQDLRTPLQEILQSIRMLKEDVAENETPVTKSCLDLLHEDTASLVEMVDSLLEIHYLQSQDTPLETENVSLKSIVENVLHDLSDVKQPISFEMPHGDMRVTCNEKILKQAILNQIGCSLKCSIPSKPIVVTVDQQGDFARISVQYKGSGLPIENGEWIIDKFSQTRMRHAHTMPSICVGMTYCKMAIEAHGGQLGISSDSNMGNSFWFSIPLAMEYAEVPTYPISFGEADEL